MKEITGATNVDWEMSRKIAEFVDAEVQGCWKNASLALLAGDEWADYTYVEGICLRVIVFEHGWLEKPDGTVVDPTLILTHDADDWPVTWFPVDRYSREDLFALWDAQPDG